MPGERAGDAGGRARRDIAIVAVVAFVLLAVPLPRVPAGTGPGEFFLDASGLRALQATLADSGHRADLCARSSVLALRAIWGSVEASTTDDCSPSGEGDGGPEQFRLRFDFALREARSSRVYRAEYTCCRVAGESYASRFSTAGFRAGTSGTSVVLAGARPLEILNAALSEDATFVPLLALAAAGGIRHLEIQRSECDDSAPVLEYLFMASSQPAAKWPIDTEIVAFLVRIEAQSGAIEFEAIDGAALLGDDEG